MPYWYSDRGSARLRASDADRDRGAAQLREHCAAGRLTLEELYDRLDQTFRARTLGDLQGVLFDLPDLDASPVTNRRGLRPVRHPRLRLGRVALLLLVAWLLVRVLLVASPPGLAAGWMIVALIFLFGRHFLAPRRLSRHNR